MSTSTVRRPHPSRVIRPIPSMRVHKVAVRRLANGAPFVGLVTVVMPSTATPAQVLVRAYETARRDAALPASVALTGSVLRPRVSA